MLGRYAGCNLCMYRPILYLSAQRICSSNSKDKLIISDLEHNDRILKIINSKSGNYLNRYKIPISQVNALQLYREKHGLFKSVKDILNVEGMTKSILNEFVAEVMSNKQRNKKQRSMNNTIMPSLESTQRETISTILGICTGVNVVTWMLLDLEANVLEWSYESFSDISENNTTLTLLEMAWELNFKLPKSDVYVVDDMNYDHRIARSPTHMKAYLQKQQLKAMILALLKNRTSSPEHNEPTSNLYLTQHEKVASLFGLRVGSEITNSSTITKRLLLERNEQKNDNKNPCGVYASKDIMDTYRNQVNYVKDQMNWSLLTAVTFLQLGIFEKYNNFV